ncbi:MAG: hypothetical protein FWG90_03770 [Oscillospiraceae bacterium]|nr:hypothetical protein [Oscillospiraceae bacterium]
MITSINSLRSHINGGIYSRNSGVAAARKFTYGKNSFSSVSNILNNKLSEKDTDKRIKEALDKNGVPKDVKFSLEYDRTKNSFVLTEVSNEDYTSKVKKSLEEALGTSITDGVTKKEEK